ncbi:MAG TPA: hypothetical protein VLC98_08130 [Phnomibacter sp.]|nr:hypothetical protein [Phnomibacter sp.]
MKFRTLLLVFTLLSSSILTAQRFSGSYYGRGESRTGQQYNSYLTELIILKKGEAITGEFNYYFGQSHYTTKISGKFWPRTKTIELNPFKLISFFAKDSTAPDCMMDGSLTMYITDTDTVLYGQLTPLASHRFGCPTITISVTKAMPEIVANKLTPNTATNPVKPTAAATAAIIPVANQQVPELLKRSFDTSHVLDVSSDTVMLHLYDNGKVDYDTVSVYFNREPIISKKMLSLKPIEMQIVLKPGYNEIALFAENLGEIPPNTALCIVYAGSERFDINLASSMITNGTIRIRNKLKPLPK